MSMFGTNSCNVKNYYTYRTMQFKTSLIQLTWSGRHDNHHLSHLLCAMLVYVSTIIASIMGAFDI